jgi:hypothetical protein
VRMLAGLIVAGCTAIELVGRGALVAVAGFDLTLIAVVFTVGLWDRWQLHLARKRLAVARARLRANRSRRAGEIRKREGSPRLGPRAWPPRR